MAKARKKASALHINASVWLKGENRFALLKNLEHTPRAGDGAKRNVVNFLSLRFEHWKEVRRWREASPTKL